MKNARTRASSAAVPRGPAGACAAARSRRPAGWNAGIFRGAFDVRASDINEAMKVAAAEALAKDLLAKVGLAERVHHFPSELSGGQQQRVAIARALAVKPKMMLFDEPTSALDPELRHEVLKVMQDLAEEGMTMVIVTHEIGFAEKVASRLIFIDKGRIAEDGNPQELVKNPPSQRLQEFLQHVS